MNSTGYILALQLCIILASCSCYCQDIFTPEINKLKEYFNASKSDVANGEVLFLNILDNWKADNDKIIQSQIASFYFKLFDTVKDQHIQSSIDAIKEGLIANVFNGSAHKAWDFRNLTEIPVNNRLVQRKAIGELQTVIQNLLPAQKKRKRSFRIGAHQNKNRPVSAI